MCICLSIISGHVLEHYSGYHIQKTSFFFVTIQKTSFITKKHMFLSQSMIRWVIIGLLLVSQ